MKRVFGAITIALLGMAGAASAQPAGDAAAGKRLAETYCARCHWIEPDASARLGAPPNFSAVARMPSATALSLRVFLQTPHGEMPRIQFTPAEMDAIIAYILSMRP